MYVSVKENDGTYTIRYSEFGANYEIIKSGVRGCNVAAVIRRLRKDDIKKFYETLPENNDK